MDVLKLNIKALTDLMNNYPNSATIIYIMLILTSQKLDTYNQSKINKHIINQNIISDRNFYRVIGQLKKSGYIQIVQDKEEDCSIYTFPQEEISTEIKHSDEKLETELKPEIEPNSNSNSNLKESSIINVINLREEKISINNNNEEAPVNEIENEEDELESKSPEEVLEYFNKVNFDF